MGPAVAPRCHTSPDCPRRTLVWYPAARRYLHDLHALRRRLDELGRELAPLVAVSELAIATQPRTTSRRLPPAAPAGGCWPEGSARHMYMRHVRRFGIRHHSISGIGARPSSLQARFKTRSVFQERHRDDVAELPVEAPRRGADAEQRLTEPELLGPRGKGSTGLWARGGGDPWEASDRVRSAGGVHWAGRPSQARASMVWSMMTTWGVEQAVGHGGR